MIAFLKFPIIIILYDWILSISYHCKTALGSGTNVVKIAGGIISKLMYCAVMRASWGIRNSKKTSVKLNEIVIY